MKKFVISVLIFLVLTGFIIFHSVEMLNFGKEMETIAEVIKTSAQDEDWDAVRKDLKKFEKLWMEKRTWATLTIKTTVIEDIDISLEQSKTHAQNETKPDFLGEFIMLKRLVEHIPHQEGFHIEEIL